MKNSMKEMLFAVIVVSGAQGSSYSFAGAPDDPQVPGVGALIQELGSCIGLVVNVYDAGKGIVSYVLPGDTEQARAREIDKQMELIKLRRELRKCLIRNRTTREKGPLGVPTPCSELARAFSSLETSGEVTRMAIIFNAFSK